MKLNKRLCWMCETPLHLRSIEPVKGTLVLQTYGCAECDREQTLLTQEADLDKLVANC